MSEAVIHMSRTEIQRLHIIRRVLEKRLSQRKASWVQGHPNGHEIITSLLLSLPALWADLNIKFIKGATKRK